MGFLRQIMIVALMPVMAWSGAPHVACQCSTGEVRLFCPRLHSPALDFRCNHSNNSSASCCSQAAASSCDETSETECCCCRAKAAQTTPQSSCCSQSCRCTPIVLPASNATAPKSESVSSVCRADFAAQTVSCMHLPRVVNVRVNSHDTGPPPLPVDIIVLFARFVI